MNTDPKLTNPETEGDQQAALLALIGDLLADQNSPAIYSKILHLLGTMSGSQPQSLIESGLPNREGRRTDHFPKFRSAQAGMFLEQAYPSRHALPGFGIEVSGNSISGLLQPALPITPKLRSNDLHEGTLDSMGANRDIVHVHGIPSLPKAILDRRSGFDSTVKPNNKGLIELSLPSFRYLTDLLALPLSDRALVSILTPLLVQDFWNINKSDPGGQTVILPVIGSTGIRIDNLLSELTPKGMREVGRVMPYLRKWLRLIQTQATAGLNLLEGDPFSGNLEHDHSMQKFANDLQNMRRSGGRFAQTPLLGEVVREIKTHPLRRYAFAMKSWNSEEWQRLIEHPELLAHASVELKKMKGLRTIMIAAATGAGKSSLGRRIVTDQRSLLGENNPGSRQRFLGIGNAIIGLRSGQDLEQFNADSPFGLLFSAIDRADSLHSDNPETTTILMEIPPTVHIGMPVGETRRKNMTRQEIAQATCNPAHVGTRLMRNGTRIEDICEHDSEIAAISTIALSRIAGGNIQAIALPMRRNEGNLGLIAGLSHIQPDTSEVWTAETTLSHLRAIFTLLPADIRSLWWMSSIANAPLVPMVREFPGELTRDDAYNEDLGAVHYLLCLHNIGALEIQADGVAFPKQIGKFLPDGRINLRKLAMKIPQESPLRSLITIADHLKDNLHGSGITNTSQFLYGLALSLYSLSAEKNIRI